MDLREAVNDQFVGGYESEQEVESQLMGNFGNACPSIAHSSRLTLLTK
jgi:hypothetical protein